jgi:hypothetical protein
LLDRTLEASLSAAVHSDDGQTEAAVVAPVSAE